MDEQREVAEFVARHDLAIDPTYRALDLVAEVGEVATEIVESTRYGAADEAAIAPDELGDVLFALLALADGVDVDAGSALEVAIEKYEARLDESGHPGSS